MNSSDPPYTHTHTHNTYKHRQTCGLWSPGYLASSGLLRMCRISFVKSHIFVNECLLITRHINKAGFALGGVTHLAFCSVEASLCSVRTSDDSAKAVCRCNALMNVTWRSWVQSSRKDVWEQTDRMTQRGSESGSCNEKACSLCPSGAAYMIEASLSTSHHSVFSVSVVNRHFLPSLSLFLFF